MKRNIILTADGSYTIQMEEWNEHYHSTHGALQEARHVFIKNGLSFLKVKRPIHVFEVGFGTGLNAMVAAEYALENTVAIAYTGIEAYPIELELVQKLNYTDFFSKELRSIFFQMHHLEWGVAHVMSPHLHFHKIHAKIEDCAVPHKQYDIVFFDAFGPRVQEELWRPDVLQKMYDLLLPGGVFVTYCAKGQLKRDLRHLGFDVQSLQGPPGKREMIRAVKL